LYTAFLYITSIDVDGDVFFFTILKPKVNTSEAETAYPSGTHELTPVFSGVRIAQFLAICVDRCLSFCTFSFGYCVVCPLSIYGF
jgi:hypothetical protein